MNKANGRALLNASWQLLRKDTELLWLPVLSAAFTTLAALAIFGAGFGLGLVDPDTDFDSPRVSAIAVVVVVAVVTTVVAVFFQVALAAAAVERADGGDPDLRSALAAAWARRMVILKWAVVLATVGLLLRLIQERLGGLAGFLTRLIGEAAWGVATYFVVPILAVDEVGPVDALRSSGRLMKATWGKVAKTSVPFWGLGLLLWVPGFFLLTAGLGLLAVAPGPGAAIGVLVASLGALGLVAAGMVVSAVGTYVRVVLYRHATGAPIPGIEPSLAARAF
ncbi:DUF6159 family protein [Angustibacter sp. McL0619]|uniref:DUF6159 family protein n=1 Tax=Angustibacter sp. McL0619 TaxID=3415676 RepID=UPI003CE6FEC3